MFHCPLAYIILNEKAFWNPFFHIFYELCYYAIPWCGFLQVSFALGSLRFLDLWVYSFFYLFGKIRHYFFKLSPPRLETSMMCILRHLM